MMLIRSINCLISNYSLQGHTSHPVHLCRRLIDQDLQWLGNYRMHLLAYLHHLHPYPLDLGYNEVGNYPIK